MKKLDEIKKLFASVRDDKTRVAKMEVWQKAERQVNGYLKPRSDDRGSRLAHININQSAKAVHYLTQTFFNLFHNTQLFEYKPVGIDDITTARLITNTVNGKIRQIVDFEWSLLMVTLQNWTYGWTAGKFFPKPKWAFEYINPFDIYINNAKSFNTISFIAQKVWWSKEELEVLQKDDKYKKGEVENFIAKGNYEYEVFNTDASVAYDTISYADIKKTLKPEYAGLEIWYKEEDTWYEVLMGFMDIKSAEEITSIPAFELLHQKTPYWMGHPYVFGNDIPDFRSLYGNGEPERIADLQEHCNMFVNLMIDYLADGVRTPLIHEPNFIENVALLDPLLNAGMGGNVEVSFLDGAKYLAKPPLNPQVFNMLPMLLAQADQMTTLYGVIQGEPPAREEPATTTLRRQELASGGVKFKFNLFFSTFLHSLAEKMVLSLFEYPPEDELIAFGGANEEFIKIKKGDDLRAEQMKDEKGQTTQPYYVLMLPKNREVAKKFTQDIIIGNDMAEKLNQVEQKNLLFYLQTLVQAMAVAPELRAGSNIADLLEDIFYQMGGNKTKKYFNADKVREMAEQLQSQGTLQGGKMPMGEVTPAGEGAPGEGALLRGKLGMGG